MNRQNFDEMNISQDTLNAIRDMGFEEATPIQSRSIEIIMSGRDVLGQSQTGTGKTAAFGIPCLEMIDPDNKRLQAVILCPTRELAIQISEEFRKLLKYRDSIKVAPIYGGQPIERQIAALRKGVQVIIGTPGRVMDHMDRRTLKMDTVKMIVLDEADEMLDMGFREDIETILAKVPETRQTILFSATMPDAIMSLANKYQSEPEIIKVAHKELTVPSISQYYFDVKEKIKLDALCRIIDLEGPELSLVFVNTKKKVDEVVEKLQGRGYFAEGLHGDMKQMQRDAVMKKFRNRTLEILVATDVAARGIDVDDIDIVFNYDLPQDEEYYVHRIGRTGRAGKNGKAYTFVEGKEIYRLREITWFTKSKILPRKLPTLTDIEEVKTSQFLDKLKDIIEQGHLIKYANIIEELTAEDFNTLDIAAALLKMHLQESDEDESDLDREIANIYYENERERRRLSKSESSKRESNKRGGKSEMFISDFGKDTVRLFINLGKTNGVKAKDVLGFITGETGVSGKYIGRIDIYDKFTFVDVPKPYAKVIISGLKNVKFKGVKINVEKANKK